MSARRRFIELVGKPGHGQSGVTALEYALIAGLASIALFAGAEAIGQALVRVLLRLGAQPFW